MEQDKTDAAVSVEELLKALLGEDNYHLQLLDSQNIKSTILFLEAARGRLNTLVNKAVPQSNEG